MELAVNVPLMLGSYCRFWITNPLQSNSCCKDSIPCHGNHVRNLSFCSSGMNWISIVLIAFHDRMQITKRTNQESKSSKLDYESCNGHEFHHQHAWDVSIAWYAITYCRACLANLVMFLFVITSSNKQEWMPFISCALTFLQAPLTKAQTYSTPWLARKLCVTLWCQCNLDAKKYGATSPPCSWNYDTFPWSVTS